MSHSTLLSYENKIILLVSRFLKQDVIGYDVGDQYTPRTRELYTNQVLLYKTITFYVWCKVSESYSIFILRSY